MADDQEKTVLIHLDDPVGTFRGARRRQEAGAAFGKSLRIGSSQIRHAPAGDYRRNR